MGENEPLTPTNGEAERQKLIEQINAGCTHLDILRLRCLAHEAGWQLMALHIEYAESTLRESRQELAHWLFTVGTALEKKEG